MRAVILLYTGLLCLGALGPGAGHAQSVAAVPSPVVPAVPSPVVPAVPSLGATAATAGAQSIPTDADIAKVLRALAILRGTPAIVPLTEAVPPPLPVVPPAPVPVVVAPLPPPPPAAPLKAPVMGIRVRRSAPFGSIPTEPKNLGINKGF